MSCDALKDVEARISSAPTMERDREGCFALRALPFLGCSSVTTRRKTTMRRSVVRGLRKVGAVDDFSNAACILTLFLLKLGTC